MKKKIIGILVCMLLIATAVPAVGTINKNTNEKTVLQLPNGVEWDLTIDRGEFDSIRHVEQTSDGGYIGCGLTEESDMFYCYLIKVDSDGNEDWRVINYDLNASYVTSPSSDVYAMNVIQTSEGGYLVSGWGMIFEEEAEGWAPVGYLWKTDSTGTTEWIQRYYKIEDYAIDFIYPALEIDDGYMASGFRIYYDPETYEVLDINGFLMKVDTLGTIQWHEAYDAGGSDHLCSLCPTDDGGYLLTGCTDAIDEDSSLWMVKTDSDGIKEWDQIFDGPDWEYSYAIDCHQTSDGGFIMVGNTISYEAVAVDVWVIKTDSSGNMEWYRLLGGTGNDYTWTICKTIDGRYVVGICDNYGSFSGTMDDILLVKITEDGLVEWEYLIEEEGVQIPTTVRQTSDEGFVVSGRTATMGHTNSDGIMVKVSAIENQIPDKPDRPSGKKKIMPGAKYTYKTSTSDPDGDQVYYLWDWGDGNFSEWLGPYNSTEVCEADNYWEKDGTYNITVMAKDSNGGESEWADTLRVTTPKNKAFNYNFPLLSWLLERFPHIILILRQIFG